MSNCQTVAVIREMHSTCFMSFQTIFLDFQNILDNKVMSKEIIVSLIPSLLLGTVPLLAFLVQKVYNNPQKTGLISKKFPYGRKCAILERYYNALIFRILVFSGKKSSSECVTVNPFWVVN